MNNSLSSHKLIKKQVMNNKGKGLLALLGLAGGAFAFWKYKNMSPEEKQQLKNKANETGRKIKEKAGEVEDTISEKYDQLKKSANREVNNLEMKAKDVSH